MKPNAYICGGFDLNCDHWDDINGCMRGCKSVGGVDCCPPAPDEVDDLYEN